MNYRLTVQLADPQTGNFGEHSGSKSRGAGFYPAFLDRQTGRTEVSRTTEGAIAAVHLLSGVPPEWVAERDTGGNVTALKDSVVAGFVRSGRFYTRKEAEQFLQGLRTQAPGH
jgi:hypothetical protein